MGCGTTVLRIVLGVFNFLIWAAGAALLGVGIWMAVDPNASNILPIIKEAGMNDPLFAAAVYTMISVGGLAFLLGFLGCCGAKTQNSCLLVIYSILIFVCLLGELVAIILAAVFSSEINTTVEADMTRQVQQVYYGPTANQVTEAWDSMQQDWKCCGSVSYEDYQNSYYYNSSNNAVPESCCEGKTTNYTACLAEATSSTMPKQYLYTTGCYQELKNFLDENSAIIIGICCGIIAVEIIALVFALCVRKSKENYHV